MSWKGWEDYVPLSRGPSPAAFVKSEKRHKYHAEPTEVDGVTFASKREADRYRALLLEQQAGLITDLQLQPQFALHVQRPDGVKVCIGRYIADFGYTRDGERIIEDAKGMKTALYLWKKNHVEAEHGITVREV